MAKSGFPEFPDGTKHDYSHLHRLRLPRDDCIRLPVSTVSPSFGRQFFFQCVRSSVPISVVTTAGAFSCLVNLIKQLVDTVMI
jgi:hypothetical protein